MFGSIRVCVFFCFFLSFHHIFEYVDSICLFTCMYMLLRHLRVA